MRWSGACLVATFSTIFTICGLCFAGNIEIGKTYHGEFGGEKRPYNPINEGGGHRGLFYQAELPVTLKAGENYTFNIVASKNCSVSIRVVDPKGEHTGEGSSIPDLQKQTFTRKIEDVHVTGEYKVLLACDRIGKYEFRYTATHETDTSEADEDEVSVLERRQAELIRELYSVSERLNKLRGAKRGAK